MERLHFFPGLTLITKLQPDGYYNCYEFDNYDLDCLETFGKTREEAIEYYSDELDARDLRC
jgi:hypothetical protein